MIQNIESFKKKKYFEEKYQKVDTSLNNEQSLGDSIYINKDLYE
jgi:hypothetical protein